jgi:hypothetical protein
LLVVIILGVFAGLAVPSFQKTYFNLELNNTANNIAFLLRYAQARCVAERTNYRLNFDAGNKSCWLERESLSDHTSFEKVSSRFAKPIIFPADIKVEPEVKIINLFPDGKIDNVSIFIKHNDKTILTVSTKGQIGYVEVLDFKG